MKYTTTTTTRRRARWVVALGALAIVLTMAPCPAGPDGSCRAPTPCGSNQGGNP